MPLPWANARVANLLSVQRDSVTIVNNHASEGPRMDEYDEVVVTKNMETVDAFSSCIIPTKVEKAYTGEHINTIAQVL